ncbi:monocarboxylate transporter 10-like isoform X1 [Montipora foliosa]|uniref:monocarboxylate transporter 10-like isoform X1 n=1 Tax=Montipora foliosa TaxID=591990 RepID=UPI0035F103D7
MTISQLFCSTGPPHKRDSLWSWLVCACATITWISALGFVFSFGVFLPVFMDYFNASREITALVGSVAIALTFFNGFFSTTLVSWLGCRITALMGGAICAISLIVSSFVKNILLLLLTYSVLFGFGCSCTFAAGLIVIKQYFSKRQSIAAGVLTAGIGGGVLIMGPALEALTRAFNWQTTFLIIAGVNFFVSLFSITFDPNVEEDQKKEMEQAREERKHRSIISAIKTVFDVSIWTEPPVIAFFLPEALVAFGHFVPQIHLNRYCEELGISSEKAAELMIYRGLFSFSGRLLAGILCSHPKVDTFSVFQAAECTAGLSAIFMTVNPTYTSLIVCNIIYGLGDGFFFTCVNCLLLSVSPLKTAAVLAWEMLLKSMFAASGSPLAGLLADKLGSYVVPFRVAGGITLAGAFIPFMLLFYKRTSQPTEILQQDHESQTLLK